MATDDAPHPNPPSPAEAPRVGPYRLLEVIGSGGFGVVWRAEREEPYRAVVALKMIKPGMGSDDVLARFEQERQALAVMDHPNVARVLDGGVTTPEMGSRPYFVMEFVDGNDVVKYADEHRLSVRQRLDLFAQICDGVHHAHTKGIIHRDIKPSNILVAEVDGKPVPKVIDFGVAKALDRPLTDKTILTEHGRLIGTPEYISPEQADLGARDIDTRSDVYSLGVVLYQLLTGQTPFDRHKLLSQGFNEICRIIKEVDPPRPSTRLSSLGDGASEVAMRRGVDPRLLVRVLANDLEWIPLKAMEKDRRRRQASAAELAEDVRIYLEEGWVRPRPPTRWYRATRFARRHKGPIAAAALVVIALAAGLVSTLVQLDRTRAAESLARRSAYEGNIAAAAALVPIDAVESALVRLDACPPELRGFEWRRLKHQCNGSLASIAMAEPLHSVEFAGDSSRILALGWSHAFELPPQLEDTRVLFKHRPERMGPHPLGRPLRIVGDAGEVLFAPSSSAATGRFLRARPDAEPAQLLVLGPGDEPVAGIAPVVCARGRTIAMVIRSADSHAILVQQDGRDVSRLGVPQQPRLIAISRGGTWLAAAWTDARGDFAARIWNLAAGAPADVAAPRSMIGGPTGLALNDRGDAAACGELGAAAWRTAEPAPRPLPRCAGAAHIALTEDGRLAAVAVLNRIELREIGSNAGSTLRGQRSAVKSLAFSPDSRRLVSATEAGNISLWPVATSEAAAPESSLTAASISADAAVIAVYNDAAPGGVHIFSTRDRTWTTIAADRRIRRAALDPAGARLGVLTDDEASVFSVADGSEIARCRCADAGIDWAALRPEVPASSAARITFAPGNDPILFLTLSPFAADGRVLRLNVRTGEASDFATFDADVGSAIGADGRNLWLAYARRARIWRDPLSASPAEPAATLHPVEASAQLAFDADLNYAAGIGINGGLWACRLDALERSGPRTGQPVIHNVKGHTPRGRAIALLAGEDRLATGASDGNVIIWSLEPPTQLMTEPVGASVVALGYCRQTRTLWAVLADGRIRAMASPEPPSP